jgi:DNA-binding CsgD family transcriptional regulator
MKTQTLLEHPDKFTSSEFTVLKSMALGLSCDEIRKLLDLKSDKYDFVCRGLFEKLGASNHYTAVKNAYQKKYLDHKEHSLEDIKSFSLEFAYKNVERLKTNYQDPKHLLWVFYDLLLDFHFQIEKEQS